MKSLDLRHSLLRLQKKFGSAGLLAGKMFLRRARRAAALQWA